MIRLVSGAVTVDTANVPLFTGEVGTIQYVAIRPLDGDIYLCAAGSGSGLLLKQEEVFELSHNDFSDDVLRDRLELFAYSAAPVDVRVMAVLR